MIYKFTSQSRDYSEYNIDPSLQINPIESKLFHNDSFEIINNNIIIKESDFRENQFHCGVLILQGNKTFGKAKKGKMFYKCIPYEKELPIFLIPYELRIGFNKNHINKYVMFSFDHWEDKHPIGILKETFGNVDNFSSFCSYQLWCKNLVYSNAQFQRQVKFCVKHTNEESIFKNIFEKYRLVDKTKEYVFSIDPQGSKDIDDAFTIIDLENDCYQINIHIANVYVLLDYLELWTFLTNRVSTIYLPEERKTMLPELLSENLCSLLENKTRVAFTMEIIYKNGTIQSTNFFNSLICVSNNYNYDETRLLENKNYQNMFNVTKQLDNDVTDSHELVSFWMVYMNKTIAEILQKNCTGVFRVVESKNNVTFASNDSVIKNTLETWNNISGSYRLFSPNSIFFHKTLEASHYVHITSPIRRIVDIVNQTYFFNSHFQASLKKECVDFLKKFETNIEQINIDMKSIKKIQSECDLLYLCMHNNEFMEMTHEGFVFNKTWNKDIYVYQVYLKTINKISFFKTTLDLNENSLYCFKLYLFDQENSGHRKIRIGMVENTDKIDLQSI